MMGFDRAIHRATEVSPKNQAGIMPVRNKQTYLDVSDYSVSQQDWSVHTNQFGSGRFKATHEMLRIGQITIARERINMAVTQDTSSPRDQLCLLFPRQSHHGWRVNAHYESEAVVAMRRGGTELLIQQSGESEIINVELPLKLAGTENRSPSVESRPISPYDVQLVDWLNCLLAQDEPMTIEMAEALEDILFMRLMHCQHLFHSTVRMNLTRPALVDLLKKIEHHLKNDDQQPSNLAALAQALQTTPAEITSALQRAYGYKADYWFRIRRLNGARQALIRAKHKNAVTGTATQWGFFHLGRFSMEYKALFGEGPNETLRSR
ncbi:helix-turn-helix domain-containing protein [Allorhizobium terrae]|uniref:Helix-turn-helix domain-containing protein n=1 Tax=Allorhizobium terrae TaxID=1848972 RepID=A0A4V6RWV5_9HYPH|nr:helix-turn-helix domain-containing protein [Allorhizobium terrae]THF52223.1 helix-turn-helix domain-containing protein [Allorhizobium terrae]